MSVRARACCFSVNPFAFVLFYREKKGERSARNCEVGKKNTEEKRTLIIDEEDLFVPFGPSFFLLLFSFPFSLSPPMSKRQTKTKTKRRKEKNSCENS